MCSVAYVNPARIPGTNLPYACYEAAQGLALPVLGNLGRD
jgi:hypothetical protein